MTTHRKPTTEDKLIAKHAAQAFGGEPHVREWAQDDSDRVLDMVWAEKSPRANVTSYATIGLWRFPLTLQGRMAPTRVELCGAFQTPLDVFPEALSGLAFHMMQIQMMFPSGSVMPEYFEEWALETTLPHLYITTPNLWAPNAFPELTVGDVKVNWLQVVPISEAERVFLKNKGEPAFQQRLKEKAVEVWNPARPSVV